MSKTCFKACILYIETISVSIKSLKILYLIEKKKNSSHNYLIINNEQLNKHSEVKNLGHVHL